MHVEILQLMRMHKRPEALHQAQILSCM
jgi:hypothetical protein